MSRHTRETLRQYARDGRIQATIPERRVHPVAIRMNEAERRLYDDIDALVNEVYDSAPGINSTAVGFIMTTYRRRLGSSPAPSPKPAAIIYNANRTTPPPGAKLPN